MTTPTTPTPAAGRGEGRAHDGPLCTCGHDARSHLDFAQTADCMESECDCAAFTPASPAAPQPAPAEAAGVVFDLDAFSAENRARCEAPDGFNHAMDSWSLSDWMTATVGELGEAANVAKKLNRVRDGIRGNREAEAELRQKLASEIADAFIYLDLMAQSQGIRLSDAVRRTFDAKSAQIGYTATRTPAPTTRAWPLACPDCGEPPTYMAPVVRSDARLFTCINDHDWRWTPATPTARGDGAAPGGEPLQVLVENLIAAAELRQGPVVGTLRIRVLAAHERALAAARAREGAPEAPVGLVADLTASVVVWEDAARSVRNPELRQLYADRIARLRTLADWFAALRPARDDSTEVGRG